MRAMDIAGTALGEIVANKLRSFFTLLGIIVSVAFLVAVVAIIEGMNAYVKENIRGAVIGANAFAVRRTPLQIGTARTGVFPNGATTPVVTHRGSSNCSSTAMMADPGVAAEVSGAALRTHTPERTWS